MMALRDTIAVLLLVLPGFTVHALAASGDAAKGAPPAIVHPDAGLAAAPVEIDGTELFRVRGVPAFPAAERAAAIAERIESLAADHNFKPEDLHIVESDIGSDLGAGDKRVMTITDEDGRLEGAGRKVLAAVYAPRIREAIEAWRAARTTTALERGAAYAAAATVALA